MDNTKNNYITSPCSISEIQNEKHCVLNSGAVGDYGSVKNYVCHEVDDIVTPINYKILEDLLQSTSFEQEKISKLVDGFRDGFDLGYEGPIDRIDKSDNIPFTVGNEFEMWDKIMKEVELKRYAGPFTENQIPYKIMCNLQ